ncbi:MAG: hypothetical protein HY661_06745, partial [Betaproteobacteria bacterium]|nr:hypothetical protein [Betaproteobacteria bacterium]
MSERKQSYAAALVDALHDGLGADSRVSIIGGYVLGLGPQRTLTDRLKQDFPDRVFDPPTSEAGNAAVGIGDTLSRCLIERENPAYGFGAALCH